MLANLEVVIPYITAETQIKQDSEDLIAVCTIRSFPYKIQHTIEWAMDSFETNFS